MKNKIILIALLAVPLLFVGGCKATLEPGGAYAPVAGISDMPLCIADSSYKLVTQVLDAAFLYERKNQAALWAISPQIKHKMDELRVYNIQYQKDWAVARQAYLANKTPQNLTTMQGVVAKLQQLSAVATTVVERKGT